MHRIKGVILLIIMIVIGSLFVIGQKPKEGRVILFKYSVSGSRAGWREYYEIVQQDDKLILKTNKEGSYSCDVFNEVEIGKEVLSELTDYINEQHIYKWDGYEKFDKNVLDGNSWSLYIKYDSGNTISASGYMKHPKDFHQKMTGMIEIINKHIIKSE